jgi:RNA polymerase sigma factor (sigma-70 family)
LFIEKNKPYFKTLCLDSRKVFHTRIETYLRNLSGSTAATSEYTASYQNGGEINLRVVLLGSFSLESKSGSTPTQVAKLYASFIREKVQRISNSHLPWIRQFEDSGLNCKASLQMTVKDGKVIRLTPTGSLNGNCETQNELLDVLARVKRDNDSFFLNSFAGIPLSDDGPNESDEEYSENIYVAKEFDLILGEKSAASFKQVEVPGPTADPVADYLLRIKHYRVLTSQEEKKLFKAIEDGRKASESLSKTPHIKALEKRRLISLIRDGDYCQREVLNCNLKLVVSIARRFSGMGLDLLELIQEGNLGLIRAMEKFDFELGYKFSTYSTWWITQHINRALADKSRTIRLPVHVVEVTNKINRFERYYERAHGSLPSYDEISEELDIPINKILELKDFSRPVISLDMPVGDESVLELLDILVTNVQESVEDLALKAQTIQDVRALVKTLNEREAKVLILRFGLDDDNPRTLEEIGIALNLTRERVRQIEQKVISKVRHPFRAYMWDLIDEN